MRLVRVASLFVLKQRDFHRQKYSSAINVFETVAQYPAIVAPVSTVGSRVVELETRRPVMSFIRKFVKNSKGATAIEYGLIAALIAVAAVSAMGALGGKLNSTFNNVSANLK
jgi:pilus assembly protein Flp/PilA